MILDNFKLDGKTALVTGCRRGIGKAMAKAFLGEGAGAVVLADLGETAVQTATNLSNKRFEDYKLIFEQVDADGANYQVTSFTFQWISPQKDAVKPQLIKLQLPI